MYRSNSLCTSSEILTSDPHDDPKPESAAHRTSVHSGLMLHLPCRIRIGRLSARCEGDTLIDEAGPLRSFGGPRNTKS